MSERRETVLWVEGMSCGSCVRHVDDALRAFDGVEVLEVRLEDGRVRVKHSGEPAVDAMIEALREAGYEGRVAA